MKDALELPSDFLACPYRAALSFVQPIARLGLSTLTRAGYMRRGRSGSVLQATAPPAVDWYLVLAGMPASVPRGREGSCRQVIGRGKSPSRRLSGPHG